MNDIYLRPAAGDGINDVRLRPNAPDAAGTSLGDDSDSWWAGAQRCFMAIPIAATLATVALSASLCWGAQQRNEEIVPQPAATALAGDEWIQPASQKQASWTRVWSVDDEIVPQAPVFSPDEDVWIPPSIQPQASWKRVWIANEPITLQPALEQYEWTPPYPLTRPVQLSGPVWDDQVVLTATVTVVEEDGWQPPPSLRRVVSAPVWQTDEEVIPHVEDEYWHQTYSVRHGITRSGPEWDDQAPAGSLFGVPEQDTWAPAWVSRPLTPQPLVWADDEIVPQAAGFTPEEDYQPVQLAQPQATWKKLWVGNESVVVPPVIEESSWAGYTPSRALPTLLPLWVDDEIIPQAAALTLEDDAWPLPTPRPQPVQVQVWSVTDEIVPQPAALSPEEDTWTLAVVQPQASWRRVWIANEPIALQTALDGQEWIPRGANRPTLNTQVWWVDDEIVPQAAALSPEEDTWTLAVVQPQASWKKLWVGNESVVQPQVPLEESGWTPQIITRLPVRTIWLGEDETVQPAATLKDLGVNTLMIAGVIVNSAGKRLGSALSSSGAVVKQAARALLATLSTGGVLAKIKLAFKDLGTNTLATAGALLKRTSKLLVGVLATIGLLIKSTRKSATGVLTFSATTIGQFIAVVLFPLVNLMKFVLRMTQRRSSEVHVAPTVYHDTLSMTPRRSGEVHVVPQVDAEVNVPIRSHRDTEV